MTTFAFTQDGKIKEPTPEENAKADADGYILTYTQGTAGDGRPFYAYVAVKPSKYKEFAAQCAAHQSMVLNDYGRIVESGYEASPPADVVERMRAMGYDERYEEKVKAEVQKQLTDFMATQENKRLQGIVEMLKRKGPTG